MANQLTLAFRSDGQDPLPTEVNEHCRELPLQMLRMEDEHCCELPFQTVPTGNEHCPDLPLETLPLVDVASGKWVL